jgi:hypothetical protein
MSLSFIFELLTRIDYSLRFVVLSQAQDVFQSGLIPSYTDFEVFRRAGYEGLDFALFRNGYKYHTPRDSFDSVTNGTVQHFGENILQITKHLAFHPELLQFNQHEQCKIITSKTEFCM